ncbi:(2Fe-2S)-binding protein [Pseudobacteriovorax antillogorgiicola]|uniref:Isoquinoline 1-oxidoreductase, alpha subunit n=1 Tax=Pseudobacteriovorax antillogorgiicola TaxID=1513793 RepID=A0A1Y6C2V2_9BACT|nr:(2Fe-2S)-binding protein [Pseudobacteriovorax antillogorgiicola]TCS49783.1 isoquinoline 1-oxidoreductase alpha subunit [Pseudobacteriovorax antillogorgiicola]SMF42845.1 isoquinoline 1-oxidoreductase, alpha subunit [Pseudobacteriovorax antillogorgiicola]
MTRHKLFINNKNYEVEAPDEMPLLWVIRDLLDMKGTKFGCGKGLCGACTIHLNGSAIRSCSTPVAAAKGASITTIEGLSKDGDHPLQQAWQELSVPQCGYCQSGQLMSAAALLETNKKPKDSDIDAAMAGNICRCGTYPRIRKGILKASGQVQEEAKS